MPLDTYREANRENWDGRVDVHLASEHYAVDEFVQNEDHLTTIVRHDRELIGDVQGKSMLHLMCHIGLDTLSWARLGASVTGVDFSPRSIEAARRLAHDCGLSAGFVEAELYDAPNALDGQFDIVYTSMGVLCWLPDVQGWAQVIDHFLKPGGTFLITEIHPVAWSLDQERDDEILRLVDPYFEQETPLRFDVEHSYADEQTALEHQTTYDWSHGLGEIVMALIRAGLRIELLQEYPFVYGWDALPGMEVDAEGRAWLPNGNTNVPLMYSIRAVKLAN